MTFPFKMFEKSSVLSVLVLIIYGSISKVIKSIYVMNRDEIALYWDFPGWI